MKNPSGTIKKGESVNVYEDPLSESRFEGEFIPHSFYKHTSFGKYVCEEWTGHFYGEDMTVSRIIRIREGDKS